MSKYQPLSDFLKNLPVNSYKFRFEEIEKITGEQLPPSAYQYDEWWSNSESHPLMKEVLNTGWKKTKVNFNTREVEFERVSITAFQKLKSYILNEMKPQANYQPVMIMTLIRMGGSLSKDTLAEQIKSHNLKNPNQDYKHIPVYDVLVNNGIVRRDGNHYVLNGYYDFSNEQKREIVEICEQKIQEWNSSQKNSSLVEYYIALGPWSNWDHTITHPPLRWGIRDSSASNIGVYDALKEDDIVFYYANQDPPTPFSKRGLFGVGRVSRKYIENNEAYWPDEQISNKVIYKHRFEIKNLKLVTTTEELLPWIDGLPFTKGLNHIVDQIPLEKLLEHARKKWKLDLPSIPKTNLVNYWKIAPGEKAKYWQDYQNKGIIAIGWSKLGDLSNITQEELNKRMREQYYTEVAQRYQIEYFLKIKKGDIIIANRGESTVIGIGRIVGDYKYYPALEQPHTYEVEWFDTKERQIPRQQNWYVTIQPVSSDFYEQTVSGNFTIEENYLLLRYKDSGDHKWRDELGKKYHFGKIANYTKLTKGSKTVWFDKKDGKYYFWGYGDVDDIIQDEKGEFLAIFNNFESFTPTKEAIDSIREQIESSSGYNIQSSILEINKEIYDDIVNEETMLEGKEDFISIQDFVALLNAVPRMEYLASKNSRFTITDLQLLLRLLYGSGLELDEVLNLKVQDLDLKNRIIFVTESRRFSGGPKTTILPCDVPYLEKHILKLKENDKLFKIIRQVIRVYVKNAGDLAGLEISRGKDQRRIGGLTPGLLRTSRAKQMYLDGADDDLVNLKLRNKFTNEEYKQILPTIEDLKNWESQKYPVDYNELSLRSQQNVSKDKINKEIYDEITNQRIEEQFPNTPLIFPTPEALADAKKKIQSQLLVESDIIDEIVASLYMGKNILLTGPVGSGKTHLAQLLPTLVWEKDGPYYPEMVTATSDWTTQDVIGGIFPKVKEDEISYLVQKGCVSDTVSKNWPDGSSKSGMRVKRTIEGVKYKGTWLVIDEFNRANIDRSFGQLFTALEYKKLKIPTTLPTSTYDEIVIPEDYRIIGTLNTFDKHFLFRLSDALKRRFSIIELLPPKYERKQDEIRFVAEKSISGLSDMQISLNIRSFADMQKDVKLLEILDNLYEIIAFVRLSKNLGTALLISMFRSILVNFMMNRDWEKSLDQSLTTFLLPQLESLQYWQIDCIMNFISGRIHEFFRKFDVNKNPMVDKYEEELKNLTKYLRMTGINKNATDWVPRFRTGEIMKQTSIEELNPWHNKKRPKLQRFREGLEDLKREKGYFEESEEFEE